MIKQVNTQKKTVLVQGTISAETMALLTKLENLGYTVLVRV